MKLFIASIPLRLPPVQPPIRKRKPLIPFIRTKNDSHPYSLAAVSLVAMPVVLPLSYC